MNLSGTPREIQLGAERFVVATVSLSPKEAAVSLSVLKSLDKATSFLGGLNHSLMGLGLLSVLAGSVLVFLIRIHLRAPRELGRGRSRFGNGRFQLPARKQRWG